MLDGQQRTTALFYALYEPDLPLKNNFMNYQIHIVSLPRDTELEKIVETFERINRTGEPLSIFELLTARLYKHEIKLRAILKTTKAKYTFLDYVTPEFILKTIALIRDKEPKRGNILKLDPQNFKEDWESATQSLEDAYKRVVDIKNGYGVLDFKKWMPYTTMLVPLASMLHYLKTNGLESPKNYEKIDTWYWTSIFSNMYDQAVDTSSKSDLDAIKEWISEENKIPEFTQSFEVDTIDLDVEKQTSAIYRGVISLIVLAGALDFKTGQPPQFGKERIQEDHIFPKSLYNRNLATNRTLISTNAEKSNKPPSEYFNERLKEHGDAKLKEILKSHLIPEDALDTLLRDDLDSFLEKRMEATVNVVKEKVQAVE